MRPVAVTSWPSSTTSAWPSTTAPIVVLLEVQRQTERAAFELEQLVHRRVRKTGDARDAVADLEHAADLLARRPTAGTPSTLLRSTAAMSAASMVSSAIRSSP